MTRPPPRYCCKCGGVHPADALDGERACSCICVWPLGGCGLRIWWVVDSYEKLHPVDAYAPDTPAGEWPPRIAGSHYGSCAKFAELKRSDGVQRRVTRKIGMDGKF